MIYKAKIIEVVDMNDYEGCIHLLLGSQEILTHYQVPYDYAKYHFSEGKTIVVDLWLIYGHAKIIKKKDKKIPNNIKVAGGCLQGQVQEIFNQNEFRVDCGSIKIDILNEDPIKLLPNQYIEIVGTYHVFLPSTEYSKEEVMD